MSTTTIDTLTASQIAALRDEAERSGDVATVRDCERARRGVRDGAARRRIVAVIRAAEAQVDQ